MPKINISTVIRNSPSIVYEILKAIDKFPQFMRDVKQIRIIKQVSDNKMITEWKADIDGTPVEWIEENAFDDKKRKIKFTMLEGDFQKYGGSWILKPLPQGTRLGLNAYIEWGVPNFEKYIGYILEEKACRSIRSMLWLIRKKAHGSR